MIDQLRKVKSMLGLGGPEYRVGVVLSGGGARGFAHAGALKALAEVGIKPDIIAGVSAGSVAAVMYSAGIPGDKMLELFQSAKFSDFAEIGVPKDGLFRLDRFKEFIKRNIPYENLEDLPIKTVVGVTDLDAGRKMVFEEGPLAERVVASCSIPIVFRPQVIDGVRYVDGGVLHNLPAWAIRKRCKYLIGINCSPLSQHEVGDSLVDIALRSYELMAKTNVVADAAMCDILIRTDEIAKYKVFNLKQIEQVYESGYREAMNCLLFHGFKRVGHHSEAVIPPIK